MRPWAIVLLILLSARPAQAECVGMRLDDSSFAWVFSGRVRDITTVTFGASQIATIDVDRVWKGAVPARIVVYYTAVFDGIALQPQERYLVFAYIQSPTERTGFGITDLAKTTYATNGCTIQVFSSDYTKEILGNAPGRPPSRIP